jgi:methionyl-tRNA synthetase
MNGKRYYITTPIYYVNYYPHIGHAYTTVIADVLARYKRLEGADVLFATGTDEHGVNIERRARAEGMAPQAWADKIAAAFRDTWGRFNISYDDFIRTTEPRHRDVVQRIFREAQDRGDIYRGKYEGWYCPRCESFYLEGDLVDDKACPVHRQPVEWNAEDVYLFRLSKYADWLLDHIEKHPSFIQPESRRNEVVSFVRSGLRDLAVSRSTFKWGIPVPGDPAQVVYVWIDALSNYVTVAGFNGDDAKFTRYWPADVHLVGKEILRFHAVIWPIILHSVGLEPPRQVYAHGWWSFRGEKISKSTGNLIDPWEHAQSLAQLSGAEVDVCVDAIRYFLAREIPFGQDGDWADESLLHRFNADLANDYGNLLNRTLPLVVRYFDGILPAPGPEEGGDAALRALAEGLAGEVIGHVDRHDFQRALAAIWQLLAAANKYLDAEAPWSQHKAGNASRTGTILVNTLEALRVANILLEPVLPSATLKVWTQLGRPQHEERARAERAEGRAFRGTGLTLEDAKRWRGLLPGTRVAPGAPIFPRIDLKSASPAARGERAALAGASKPAVSESTAEESPVAETITIEEFRKLDIRTAKVLEARQVPKADKLIELRVDIGAEVRTIVTGLIPHYQPQDLVGRTIIVLANLQPRTVRGVESRGMLLTAGFDGAFALLAVDPDKPAPPGAPIS